MEVLSMADPVEERRRTTRSDGTPPTGEATMDAGNSDPKNGTPHTPTQGGQQPVQQSLTFHTNVAFVFWVMCDKMRVNCDLDAQYMQMVGETKLAQLSHSESLRWMAYRDEHYKQQLAAGPPGPIVKPSLADISKIKKTH